MGFFSDLKNKLTGKKETGSYLSGFSKTNDAIGRKLRFKTTSDVKPEEFIENLMETLIEADVGFKTADKICDSFYQKCKGKLFLKQDEVFVLLCRTMREIYNKSPYEDLTVNENGPTVYLIVGVNGSGKTTSIAKLANKFMNEGKSVLLVAGDTFRAGATEQLQRWADKLGCPIVKGKENQDPASVMVDGMRKAKELGVDIVLCDTAGRLQNKVNLMAELQKMNRVMAREIEGAPHNTLLVLDSNTGQNGLSQAVLFNEVTNLNGIILTKTDGTSKGGIVLAIKDIVDVPVRYLTMGEGIDAIDDFYLELYLYSIIGDDDGQELL